MPVFAFLGLLWIDWRMAVAMFVALPLAVAVLLLSNIAQRKLSVRQIEAKINAGNRLEEYLQSIRVMKAYNLLGGKFERLKMAFSDLRRACIRSIYLILGHIDSCRIDIHDTLRYVPVDRRRTFTAHVCHVSGGRFPCFRSADICLD